MKKNNFTSEIQQETEGEAPSMASSPTKEVYYRTKNGITDTIVVDSTLVKAFIVDMDTIDNKIYIAYSKSEVKYSVKADSSIFYIAHFFNSVDLNSEPLKKYHLFKHGKIKPNEQELKITDFGWYEDHIEIKQIKKIPFADSITYVKTRSFHDDGLYVHTLIEDSSDGFLKLFEIQCSNKSIDFKVVSDSIIQVHFYIYNDQISLKDSLSYNLGSRKRLN
ncbi:hypothetical protein [Marinifilum caeruleilacunae]|uniref:Uncharacterized protein n=1 Tax=Marinifilum caeruleilacunae TaxID=2499076 RepID=A0ABX1WUY7_9BACT|nr:hypothetical protein [Marinifilum caeruleilacunae]NOU59913.1 hypothetical protein [Marinifilum caeruleilacunae]